MRWILCVGFMWATAVPATTLTTSLRPLQRPETVVAPVATAAVPSQGITQSLVPPARPKAVTQAAAKRATILAKGAVCGDVDIQGTMIGTVPAKVSGCGVTGAVKVTSVAGVKLSQAATMDCTTAKALKTWVERGAKPIIGSQGGGLSALYVMGHYSCRTRNNQKGARISEHGRGRAIDIGGFTLKNGETFTLLKHWRGSKWSDELAKMHRAACGPFGTVLGPKSDKYHQDHFHFDTARYRSGSYCR